MSCACDRSVRPCGATSTSNRPPGRPSAPNTSGCAASASPSRRSSATRPSRPTSGFVWPDLERLGQPVGVQGAQAGGVDLQRIGRVAGEQAAGEGVQARHAEALGAGEALAGRGLDVAPVRAGAGVEQHADHGQVDHRAGACRVRPTCASVGRAVDAAGLEMAPAAVVRDRSGRGSASRVDVGHLGGGRRQRVVVDAEPGRVAACARARAGAGRARARRSWCAARRRRRRRGPCPASGRRSAPTLIRPDPGPWPSSARRRPAPRRA